MILAAITVELIFLEKDTLATEGVVVYNGTVYSPPHVHRVSTALISSSDYFRVAGFGFIHYHY